MAICDDAICHWQRALSDEAALQVESCECSATTRRHVAKTAALVPPIKKTGQAKMPFGAKLAVLTYVAPDGLRYTTRSRDRSSVPIGGGLVVLKLYHFPALHLFYTPT